MGDGVVAQWGMAWWLNLGWRGGSIGMAWWLNGDGVVAQCWDGVVAQCWDGVVAQW
jgi:hypothetical protein